MGTSRRTLIVSQNGTCISLYFSCDFTDCQLQAPSAIVAALGALPPPDFNAASLVAHQHAFAWSNELVAASLQQYRLLPMLYAQDGGERHSETARALAALSSGVGEFVAILREQGVMPRLA